MNMGGAVLPPSRRRVKRRRAAAVSRMAGLARDSDDLRRTRSVLEYASPLALWSAATRRRFESADVSAHSTICNLNSALETGGLVAS
jgi:hypothetical protein